MKRSRKAFTLVELLVVITIIGMLMGLLLPAVHSARESARRTVCTNNHKQVGLASNNFESTYRRFPGFANKIGNSIGSWVAALLPFLERRDVYKHWEAGNGEDMGLVHLSVLVCPSNPPETTGVRDTSSGMICNTEIFRDNSQGRNSRGIDWLTRKDGASNTLMLTETLRIYPWEEVNPTVNGFGLETLAGGGSSSGSNNQQPGGPGSNHGGGIVAAFCDGHVKFIRSDLEAGVLPALVRGNDCDVDGGIVLDESMYSH